MKTYRGLLQKTLAAIFIGSLIIMLYGYYMGYSLSISWNVTTTAEAREFPAHTFQKGPFEFTLSGEKYSLAETFSAGPIERNYGQDAFFLILIVLGICILLTVSTYLSRYWFIAIMALFIFFLINLHLPEVGLFGLDSGSSGAVIILLFAYLVPTYLFHAFYNHLGFAVRLLSLMAISGLIVLFSGVELIALQEQLIAGSYFGFIILSLLFLLVIAEENIYAILYLITRARGGKNNHIHFAVFSLIYLGSLGLYYGKKSALLNLDFTYFDPFILLGISSLVAFWSLKFKKSVFENIIALDMARYCFAGLGILVFGFLGLAFFRGNDPVYEGLHYFIVYVHLGFGVMFFLYVIINFINPLSEGHQVYKIAYKEQNFPYVSAKLAGIAAVAAFFFLASKEPFLLFRAGYYNYLGAQAETDGQEPLSQEYFREGSIYGYDNHFSNYKLAYRLLQRNNIDDANYRFGRATLRYPSPHSYINYAGTYAIKGETTPLIVSLKNGLQDFPANNQLLNNLGLVYTDLGDLSQAREYFEQSGTDSEWTAANKVNFWKVVSTPPEEQLRQDYEAGNLAVKTNILSFLLDRDMNAALAFDSTEIHPSFPLHRTAFLINSAWYFKEKDISGILASEISGAIEESMHENAMHAFAMNQYLSGNVNAAVRSLDQLQAHAPQKNQAMYLNELGLIALEQHALPIALEYFEKALQKGSDAALINKTAALMEMGRYEETKNWAFHLTTLDSGFQALVSDLITITERGASDINQQLNRLYYYYPEYSLAEVSALLMHADSSFISSLWGKVAHEELEKENLQKLKEYASLFKSHISPAEYLETEFLLGLSENKLVRNDHRVSQLLLSSDSSRVARELASEADLNPFNTPLILAIADLLTDYDIQLAYDVLVNAIAVNKSNARLYKKYAMVALEIHLFEYAENALPKIRSLTSEQEYDDFYKKFKARQDSLSSESEW